MLKLRNATEETAVRLLKEIDKRVIGEYCLSAKEDIPLTELILATAELIRAANEVQVKPAACGTGGLAHTEGLAIVGDGGPEVIASSAKLEKKLNRLFRQETVTEVDQQEVGKLAIKAIKELQMGAGSEPLNI